MSSEKNKFLDYMWETPSIPKRGTLRWYWWFFIFVFDNPEDENKPIQFMTLWSTKDVKVTNVNDLIHTKKKPLIIRKNSSSFDGVIASWYFDGIENYHSLILENANVENRKEKKSGYIKIQGDRSQLNITGKENGYNFVITNNELELDFSIIPHLKNKFYKPIHEHKRHFKGLMEQHTFKLNNFDCSGKIKYKGKMKNLSGRGYFQRIVLNSPVPPWWWGVLFFDNGSMIKYFIPNASLGLFRRGKKDKKFLWDSAFKVIKKEFDFYDAEKDKVESFKKTRVYKEFKSDGLPTFKFKFERDDGGTLDFTLDTYSRSLYALRTKVFNTPLESTLHYNEFPCIVTNLKLDTPNRKLTLKNLGKGYGNCEHSWGILS